MKFLSAIPLHPARLALTFCALVFSAEIHAIESSSRERVSFNDGWRFQKDDPAGIGDQLNYWKIEGWLLPSANAFVAPEAAKLPPAGEAPGTKVDYAQATFNDSSWRKLNLPHDWGVEGPFDINLPGETGKLPWAGIAWYRKTFDLPSSDRDRQVYLEIDGAMSYSSVWCNGRFVGGWPYGYSAFRLDLTPYLKPGSANTLAIRLDNPPGSSRWYPGAGIYRNVWLLKTSPVAIAQWGTAITTPEITAGSAIVKLVARIDSQATAATEIQVHTQLYRLVTDKNGATTREPDAASSVTTTTIAAGKSADVTQTITVENPSLWSPATPNRYVALTRIAVNKRIIDTYETPFGIRTLKFDADNGLLVNGRRVQIQGACEHHDLGSLGAAFNLRAAERQLQILREMGVNAIRTAHGPTAPEFLDLCDRLGFLVIAESFDCWKSGKNGNDYNVLFDDWSEADLRSTVRHFRNHPSVMLWGIGNEIGEQGAPYGEGMARRLTAFTKLEDGSRPSTIAASTDSAGTNGFQHGMDVFGINYFHVNYEQFRKTNPDIPFYCSESACTVSSRGEYFFGNDSWKSDFQVTSYDQNYPYWGSTPDREFEALDKFTMMAGEFVWSGFDYLGEPTPYNSDMTNLLNYTNPQARAAAEKELKELGKVKTPARSSYFGAIDLAGFKKDRFYLYQARWRPDLPMAHILPHWNWPERVGQVTPVHVYTSGDEAELFLNGQSLGRKKKGKFEYRLKWEDVKYAPGELKVVAYKNGREWASSSVKTTGPASKLLLQPDRATIRSDGLDLSFITLAVADASGALVPRSKPPVTFAISGPGEIVSTDNGDATDLTTFSSPQRKTFNGLALVIVRAKPGAQGPITVRASSAGLAFAQAVISSQ